MSWTSRSSPLNLRVVEVATLLVVSLLAYVPNLPSATIYRDDWYYMIDRLKGGAGTFEEMFRIDRPARAPLFEAYYRLFGLQPLPYHLAGYLWRLAGAFAAWWLFHLLWPERRKAAWLTALLFLVYPGYLHWPAAVENQPHVIGLFLAVLSIAMTVMAVRSPRTGSRVGWWIGAIILGLGYLALVDYAIGLEVFRFLCVFIAIRDARPGVTLLRRLGHAARSWAVGAVVPLGFLFWKIFLFHGSRTATDFGAQVGQLLSSPGLRGSWWLVRLIQSATFEGMLAWFGTRFQELFVFRLRVIILGVGISALASAIVVVALAWMSRAEGTEVEGRIAEKSPAGQWPAQAVLMGLSGVVAGVLPVVMANRYVNSDAYSHYSFPASLPAALLATGLLLSISTRRLQVGVVGSVVALSLLTHFVASRQVVQEEATVSTFWHEVAWRAPDLLPETTLVVRYPLVNFGDDPDAASGPANIIYSPEPANRLPVWYSLYALPQVQYATKSALVGKDYGWQYRTHIGMVHYENLLILTQASPTSCVRAIDGRWPSFSSQDEDEILALGERSRLERIETAGVAPQLPPFLFGPEPEHGWCYYYEKADLAVQMGDWQSAKELGDEALSLLLRPTDPIEWTPFVQAYAVLGDRDRMAAAVPRIGEDPFARYQVCSVLTKMQAAGFFFAPGIRSLIQQSFCVVPGQAR